MNILDRYKYFDSFLISNKLLTHDDHVRVTYRMCEKGIEVVFINYGQVLGYVFFKCKDGRYYNYKYMFRYKDVQDYIKNIGMYLPEDKVLRIVKGEYLHECFKK